MNIFFVYHTGDKELKTTVNIAKEKDKEFYQSMNRKIKGSSIIGGNNIENSTQTRYLGVC